MTTALENKSKNSGAVGLEKSDSGADQVAEVDDRPRISNDPEDLKFIPRRLDRLPDESIADWLDRCYADGGYVRWKASAGAYEENREHLVQCRSCQHIIPNPHSPEIGYGGCRVSGQMHFARSEHPCELFEAVHK